MPCNFTEIALWHGYSPANLLHIFRTPFPKNTSGRLLLNQLTKHEKYEEKYEDLPEVSVKQLVIESSSISLGQIMCDVYVKTKLFASIKVS